MPSYKVTTDQGQFSVTLDSEPSSQEELMGLVAEQLEATPASAPTPAPASSTASTKKGFWGTTKSQASEGVDAIARAVKSYGSPKSPFEGVAQGMNTVADVALGVMQVVGSPIAGAGRKVGDIADSISEYLGDSPIAEKVGRALGVNPGVSKRIGNVADLATQLYAIPKVAGTVAAKLASQPRSPISAESMANAKKTVALEQEFNIPTTAGQRTGSAILSQAEAIPAKFPVGVQPVAKFGQKQEAASRKTIEAFGERISPDDLSPIEAGNIIKNFYDKAQKAARKLSDDAYEIVKQYVPATELFETPGLLKASQKLSAESTAARGVLSTRPERVGAVLEASITASGKARAAELAKYPAEYQDDIMRILKGKFGDIDNPERMMTFEGMDLLRKDLRDMRHTAVRGGKDNEARQIKELIDGITDDFRDTAIRFPQATQALEHADKLYATEVAPYFTRGKFPRVLAEKDASQISKSLIWGNRDRPENIEVVKSAINNQGEFNKVVRSWWTDLYEKSIDPKTDIFSPGRFLTNYNRFTPDVRQSLLGGNAPKADRLAELFQAIDRSTAMGANPSQTSRGISGGAQALGGVHLVSQVFAGNLPGAIRDGAMLLTPLAMGKIMMSEKGIDLLSVGLQLPAGSAEMAKVGTQLLAIANAMPKIQQNAILKDETVNIEDKIGAAMGARVGSDASREIVNHVKDSAMSIQEKISAAMGEGR